MHCVIRPVAASAYPQVLFRRRGRHLSGGKVFSRAAAPQLGFEKLPESQELDQERVEGIAKCQSCGGLGKLPRGGFHKKNPLNPAKLQRKHTCC